MNLLDLSPRTIKKILLRMQLGCFECGWNDCICDLHHILEQSKGGAHEHSNLTYLCPNCHRKAHNGLLSTFRSLNEVIGAEWQRFYNVTPNKKLSRDSKKKIAVTEKMKAALEKSRHSRSLKSQQRAGEAIIRFKRAQIDTTKYGWIARAAEKLDVVPQQVVRYLKKHAPELLIGAKLRQSRNHQVPL